MSVRLNAFLAAVFGAAVLTASYAGAWQLGLDHSHC
jgi:hypothetical protein